CGSGCARARGKARQSSDELTEWGGGCAGSIGCASGCPAAAACGGDSDARHWVLVRAVGACFDAARCGSAEADRREDCVQPAGAIDESGSYAVSAGGGALAGVG